MLHIADLGPALGAEDLHAPGLGGGDESAQVPGGAVLKAEQHRGGVVDAVVERAAVALCVDVINLPRQIHHRIDDVYAASGHAAGRAFFRAQAPVFFTKAINAGAAEVAFDMLDHAEAPVFEHALHFLQRRLKAPVVADRQRDLVVGADLKAGRCLGAGEGQRLFSEDMFAGLGCRGDEFNALGMRSGQYHCIDFWISEQRRHRVDQRKALLGGVVDCFLCAGARGTGDNADLVALALNAIDEVLSPAAEADDACIDHCGSLTGRLCGMARCIRRDFTVILTDRGGGVGGNPRRGGAA